MDYSALFKCGLLSDAVLDSKPAPWQTDAEAFTPRRHESLPSTVDELSLIIPNSTSSPQELANSVASGDSSSFYFTVRKRASKEHRSFLSLDLAESQSLRSASLKKGNVQDTRQRLKQARALNISTAAPTSSYVLYRPQFLLSYANCTLDSWLCFPHLLCLLQGVQNQVLALRMASIRFTLVSLHPPQLA